MILSLLIVFLLNIVASTMKVLNTIFISKKIMKPVYVIMFVDAILFTVGLKMVTNGESFLFILAFAFGKITGVYIANILEDKIAIGTLEVSFYANGEKAIEIADTLRHLGYGVTTLKGYGINGTPRYLLDITIERKELPLLKNIFKKFGYDNATMVIREIKGFSGKIKTTQNKDINDPYDLYS